MFGYIRPYKPELKMRDFETYRAVYCGLCHALGKRFSFPARMVLNYDATFLAILRLSVRDECRGFEKRVCPAKLSKRSCCRINGDVEYAADIAVILFYYKLKDNLHDAGLLNRLKAALLFPYVALMHKKAAKSRPQAEKIIRDFAAAQTLAELKGAGIDEAADPTGRMMAQILTDTAPESQATRRVLERMGYYLGRWVYLADAADDLAADLKSGDYNPLIYAYHLKETDALKQARCEIEKLFNACIYEICAAFELLDTCRFRPVLWNIVYLGLKETGSTILKGGKLDAI